MPVPGQPVPRPPGRRAAARARRGAARAATPATSRGGAWVSGGVWCMAGPSRGAGSAGPAGGLVMALEPPLAGSSGRRCSLSPRAHGRPPSEPGSALPRAEGRPCRLQYPCLGSAQTTTAAAAAPPHPATLEVQRHPVRTAHRRRRRPRRAGRGGGGPRSSVSTLQCPGPTQAGAGARDHRAVGGILVPRPGGARRRRRGDAVARGLPVAAGVEQHAAARTVVEHGRALEGVPVVHAAVDLAVALVALPVGRRAQHDGALSLEVGHVAQALHRQHRAGPSTRPRRRSRRTATRRRRRPGTATGRWRRAGRR